jgi:hypothetical protein
MNNVNDQLDAAITILLIFGSAQHVSGQSFAHLQERKTVFTAMGCIVLIL